MKKLFISDCTEFESGWGQKPDGFMLAEDKNLMLIEITRQHQVGSYETFWRYTDPEEVECDDETYIIFKNRLNDKGVAHFGTYDKEQLKLNLYRKL